VRQVSQVGFEIEKFVAKAGKWAKITVVQQEGQIIGGKVEMDERGRPRPPNFAYRLAGFGEVEFNTGARVVKIETLDVELKYLKCVTRRNFRGEVECTGEPTLEKQNFPARNRIKVVDDEGKDLEYWYPKKPEHADEMCDEHRPMREELMKKLTQPPPEGEANPPIKKP
jgi:hypothetical protein